MKIKLIDNSTYTVSRAEITNGRLEIDFKDRSAEEVQEIFTVQGNLSNIELLNNGNEKYGEIPGFTVYGGVITLGSVKTVILTKEINLKEERLVGIESAILELKNLIETERESFKGSVDMLQECILEMSEKVYQ